ncbi:unnamed protein product [Clavelina lepadiformis]|uniref:Uncharacterized protein n=1 Tax=Clavelina lepadiformis TaxID=159417 RepID=A0ABP0GRU7_CLALP
MASLYFKRLNRARLLTGINHQPVWFPPLNQSLKARGSGQNKIIASLALEKNPLEDHKRNHHFKLIIAYSTS